MNAGRAGGLTPMRAPALPPWPSWPWHAEHIMRSKAFLPFSALWACANNADVAVRRNSIASLFISKLLATLRDDIDQVRTPALHYFDAALDRRAQLRRILH